jgi:signal transduction histidine kinase
VNNPPEHRATRRAAARVPFQRQREGAYVAGVARGLAHSLEVDVIYVRLAFAILALASGVGIVVYLGAWILIPTSDGGAPLVASVADEDAGVRHGLALASIVLGLTLLLKRSGLWFPDRLLWPSILIAIGLGIVWRNDRRGSAGSTKAQVPHSMNWPSNMRDPRGVAKSLTDFVSGSGRNMLARIAVGVVLVLSGFGAFVASSTSFTVLRQSITAGLALALGLVLLAGPWLLRMGRDLTSERTARIRSDARAEMAEHLHDSVLQTLAIIQKQAHQPREVITLARRQERELRAWLFGGTDTSAGEHADVLSEAIEAIAEQVEHDHHVRIDVVKVGDGPSDSRTVVLLQAAREAMINAAKHSGVERISVFLEVAPSEFDNEELIEIFVRDRGKGFDQTLVADDRHGLRDSIVSRVERIGGDAKIHSEIGEGTEVTLKLARLVSNPSAASSNAIWRPAGGKSSAPTNPPRPESVPPESVPPESAPPESVPYVDAVTPNGSPTLPVGQRANEPSQ